MFGDVVCDQIPDCVPEYYRSMWEEDAHQYELWEQRQEGYQANREKIREAIAAGLPVLDYGGYESCWGCSYADHDTMRDDEDDFECVICHDPACPLHREHASGEDAD